MDENEKEPFEDDKKNLEINFDTSIKPGTHTSSELDDVSDKEKETDAADVNQETEKVAAFEKENEIDKTESANDVNTCALLAQEIGSPDETLASEDSGISLENKEEVGFDETDGNSLIYSSACLSLLEIGSKTPSDETDDLPIVPDNAYGRRIEDQKQSPEDGQIEESSLQCSDLDNALKTCDNIVESRSSGDLSTLRNSKPNSLAEDAKLVKFSVSTKSVNLMQSNAQFLNKSRNFINFITEKSTNIMEKTLLPQNIAARYNSMIRMTENAPGNYKKSIGDTTLNTESSLSHDHEINDQAAYNEAVSGNGYDIPPSVREDRDLFLKCSPSEKNSTLNSAPRELEAEAMSEHVDYSHPNMIQEDKDGNGVGSDSTSLEQENVESMRRNSVASNHGVGEKENRMPNLTSNSHAAILSERKESIEHSEGVKSEEPSVDLELLAHPAYVKILRDYSSLKNQNEKLSESMAKVEMENQRLAAENNGELQALEKSIEQLKNDLKQEIAKQEFLSKEYHLANKERESMVMKYAISEKQLIDTQRAREYAERKVNEALKEQELLHTKLKQVQGERTRICNILDGKCHELTDAQKEVDRLKEELSMREVKLKWSQNKLKTELEAHKENQQKLEKALLRMNEMKEECDQIRRESQETIRKFQQSEENKAVTLDQKLKEQQARLILERHVTEDKEMSRIQLQKEVETLKQRQHALIEENNTLSLKVQNLEKERLNYDNNLSNLKVIADQRQKEIVDLVGKVSQLETLKLQLKHKEQLLSSNEAEVERLRQSNAELQSDMEWCREREAQMLDFTQKLTDKNVRLQSEFTSLEAKNEQLELEQGPLHDQIEELSSKVKSLEISLASEKMKRTEECELLARHVAEQTQLARNLSQKLEDSQGENSVLRRKQQISVKEMTKELQQCKKRLDAFETGSPSNSLDRTSRTGSSSSLSTGETLNGAVSDNSNSGDHIIQSVEPDRQTLVERIVKLQRIRVRQAEKLDFLEEHTRTLVNELQKKAKIIKNYILHENPDAMGSNERDRNKAELARHGGIMASVYNQRVSDDNMTLELSLEINQKLQAVLEDTLLKNITLKDSIDTLGGEIARLTMQNKRRP